MTRWRRGSSGRTASRPASAIPLLLNIHGGPFTQYGNKFFDEFQAYARRGYVVVYSNPRGSSGYSEEWGRAIRGPVGGGDGWGSLDYEDLMAVVDAALEQFDFIDPERLGVIGRLVRRLHDVLDRQPHGPLQGRVLRARREQHAAPSSARPTSAGSTGRTPGVWPFEDVEPYLAQSPTTYADKITTPLLILHSENDLRCHDRAGRAPVHDPAPAAAARWSSCASRRESHELTRAGSPFHRVTRLEILLDWFARYLQ